MKTTMLAILASSMFILPASAIEPIKGSLNFDQQMQSGGIT